MCGVSGNNLPQIMCIGFLQCWRMKLSGMHLLIERTGVCVCVCSGWTLQLCMCFLGLSVLFYAEKREGLDNVCG